MKSVVFNEKEIESFKKSGVIKYAMLAQFLLNISNPRRSLSTSIAVFCSKKKTHLRDHDTSKHTLYLLLL